MLKKPTTQVPVFVELSKVLLYPIMGIHYAKAGIRYNAIDPGALSTGIAKDIDFAHLPAAALFNERIAPGMALDPRISDPAEVARLALFLASDEASFVNATTVVADGGWSAF